MAEINKFQQAAIRRNQSTIDRIDRRLDQIQNRIAKVVKDSKTEVDQLKTERQRYVDLNESYTNGELIPANEPVQTTGFAEMNLNEEEEE